MMAKNTSTADTISSPIRLMPLCLRIWTSRSIYPCSNPAEIAEVPPDHEGLADDVALRHEAPVAAVAAAVAVVSHEEEMSLGDLAFEPGVVVAAVLAKWKLAHAHQLHGGQLGVDQHVVGVLAERFAEALHPHVVQATLGILEIRLRSGGHRLPVHEQLLVAVSHGVPRGSDHP